MSVLPDRYHSKPSLPKIHANAFHEREEDSIPVGITGRIAGALCSAPYCVSIDVRRRAAVRKTHGLPWRLRWRRDSR